MSEQTGFGLTMAQGQPRKDVVYEDEDVEGTDAFFMDLLELVHKRLMITLRDGRTIVGNLESVDQFSNMILSNSFERIHVEKIYGDLPGGSMIIRGDNLVVAGEFDAEHEANNPLTKVSPREILNAQKKQQIKAEKREQNRIEAFRQRGLQYIPHDHNRDPVFRLGEDLFNKY